jgi:AbrB family looped-hinge helix DNA binding protein
MADMVTVTSKGQLVIPSKLRKKLGIRKGTKVSVREEGNHLILQPITREYIHSLRGILKGDGSAMKFLLEERKRDRDL